MRYERRLWLRGDKKKARSKEGAAGSGKTKKK